MVALLHMQHSLLVQQAQLPQRNSASVAHVYLGWLTDRAMHRTPQNRRGCIIFWHWNALIQEVLTKNGFWHDMKCHSRSFKVIHFAISYRPTKGSISPYNIVGLISEASEEVATQIAKNCRRRQPHSHSTPLSKGTPSNIPIRLIFRETRIIGLHFVAYSICLSLSHLAPSLTMFPSEFSAEVNHEETRVMGLSYNEDPVIVAWVVLTQCQRVTDRQTQRQTDGFAIASTALSIMPLCRRVVKMFQDHKPGPPCPDEQCSSTNCSYNGDGKYDSGTTWYTLRTFDAWEPVRIVPSPSKKCVFALYGNWKLKVLRAVALFVAYWLRLCAIPDLTFAFDSRRRS